MPNNIQKNPPFCSFASFLIVSLTAFINTGWPLVLKVLESPGIHFSPGNTSWKTDFLEKSPGKVLEKIIC